MSTLPEHLSRVVLPWDASQPLAAGIEALMASEGFARVFDVLGHWSSDSLVCPPERAMLFSLVRATSAREVAEIGTYFAGTARVLALAVEAVDGGRLQTIDPYGGHRVPALLDAWPAALRARVAFSTQPSSDFLLPYYPRAPFDLVFVDGGHTYPLAYHDLAATYEALRPGGMLVLDNAEQPDVVCAARHFAQHCPDLECVLVTWDPARGTSRVSALEDGEERPISFAVMRKGHLPSVGTRPVVYHLLRYRGIDVPRIRAVFSSAGASGRLRASVHLRSLPHDGSYEGIHDLGEAVDAAIDASVDRVEFTPGLRLPDAAAAQNNFLELSFRLQPGSTGALRGLVVDLGGRRLERGTTVEEA